MVNTLALGVGATALAALQLFAWLALGAWFLPASLPRPLALPLALALGSGLTAAVYAVALWTAGIDVALLLNGLLLAAAALGRWRRALALAREALASYEALVGDSRGVLLVVLGTLALYWLVAITPPRDADVLRYHLAHVQQIVADGRWLPIPDYHYALPFGWTFNYLPFERLQLPQAAHLVNLLLFLVTLGLLFRLGQQYGTRPLALAGCALLAYQPQMVKSATTALVDAYSLFIATAVTAAAVALPSANRATCFALGFLAWIGAQSRYQLLGVALATTTLVALWTGRGRLARDRAAMYVLGSALAAALAAPFYLFNLLEFRNPVWPLLVRGVDGSASYADRLAVALAPARDGPLGAESLLVGLVDLLTSPAVFPLPALVLAFLALALWRRPPPVPILAPLLALELLAWAVAQPTLFPRFILQHTPPAVIGWVALVATWRAPWLVRRWALPAGVLVLVGGLLFAGWYAYDHVRFVVTGDLATYHRHTNYYPLYAWTERHTPPGARFLVIVANGESYYLRRPQRRADPWWSGVVDWPALAAGDALVAWLREHGYDYVIYEDADWAEAEGGAAMTAAIRQAVATGGLVRVAEFDLLLNESRLLRQTVPTTVWVLRCCG